VYSLYTVEIRSLLSCTLFHSVIGGRMKGASVVQDYYIVSKRSPLSVSCRINSSTEIPIVMFSVKYTNIRTIVALYENLLGADQAFYLI
jgi:hypothetical protein